MRKFSRAAHTVRRPSESLDPETPHRRESAGIKLFAYDESSLDERDLARVEEGFEAVDRGLTSWINVDGLHDRATIDSLGDHFSLHPLLLEDVVHAAQRCKVEQYGGNTYIVIRMLEFDRLSKEINSVQISIVLAGNTLITFQEHDRDVFDGVREWIRAGRPRMRTSGTAYLAYALLDAVVDHYFVLLEEVGEHIESIEDALFRRPDRETLTDIHTLKRELIYLRKSVWPLRETINSMLRDEDLPFHDKLHVYLRDLYDHTVQVIETTESYRDLNAGMLETYLSMVSNRMNEVMKTLTIIATLFIPLTFVVGVYGMNFDHMPELHLRWGYPALWGFMVLVSIAMFRYFKRKRWL